MTEPSSRYEVGATSGGKKAVGKIRGAIAELYFMSLVDAPQRLLVTTDERFLALLQHDQGALGDGLRLVQIELPPELVEAVATVNEIASREMTT